MYVSRHEVRHVNVVRRGTASTPTSTPRLPVTHTYFHSCIHLPSPPPHTHIHIRYTPTHNPTHLHTLYKCIVYTPIHNNTLKYIQTKIHIHIQKQRDKSGRRAAVPARFRRSSGDNPSRLTARSCRTRLGRVGTQQTSLRPKSGPLPNTRISW